MRHPEVCESAFAAIMVRATRLSVMGRYRLLNLAGVAIAAARVTAPSAEVAELGVYKGGSVLLIASCFPGRRVHAFESFDGLQDLSREDRWRAGRADRGHRPGDFAITSRTTRAKVESRLSDAGIILHRGHFPESASALRSARFAFAHFDADTYRSATDFLEFFYPRLSTHGHLVLDDVEWPATPGVTLALREFEDRWHVAATPLGRNQAVVSRS